jgi:hypothetical protein
MHVINNVRVLVKELLEPEGGDVLHLLVEDLVHRVSFVLENVNQVHKLLLSKIQVVDLIAQLQALSLQFSVLLNEGAQLLQQRGIVLLVATLREIARCG